MNTKISTRTESVLKDFRFKRQEVFLYRLIFLGLGALLVCLGSHLLFKATLLHIPMASTLGLTLKTLFAFSSYLFGASSLWIACSLRTSHEMLREYFKQHKKAIQRYAAPEQVVILMDALIDIANASKRALADNPPLDEQLMIVEDAKHRFERIMQL
jgi:hypothetical protein